MSKRNKGKNKKSVIPMARLNNKDFKEHVNKDGEHKGEMVSTEKLVTIKLFTPEMSIVTDLTEEEKSLMKESDSDTMVEFIISTDGIDRDGDTISVDGWKLGNFHKNPVVPWAHKYDQPPVARAINTRVEDGSLKSKAIFTGKDLYPFGDMIGKMYKQKFLSAVSVGFNPSKFVFVEDSERKFGVDFLEQELMEYSAVPVPSNPEALIQARSKGIDINPMKGYLEELLDTDAHRKNLDIDVIENLMKIFNSKTISIGKTPETEEDTDEDGEYEIDLQDTPAEDGDTITADNTDTSEDNDKDTDSLDSTETEETEGDYVVADDMTLGLASIHAKSLLMGERSGDNEKSEYDTLSKFLLSKGIEIFDFKYVDSKVLKNFPGRFNLDEEKCLLTEKTQKEIDKDIIDTNEEIIAKAINKIKQVNPDYTYKEKDEEITFDIDDEDFLKDVDITDKDDGEPENVIDLEGIDSEEDLKSLLLSSVKRSNKTTFDSITGKLD